MNCPKCHGESFKKCGKGRKNQQRFQCLGCGKKFSVGAPLAGSRTPIDKAAQALRMLLEGVSVRATERVTGIKRDTILRFVVKAGEDCQRFLAEAVRNVPVNDVEVDDIWGFCGMKERTRQRLNRGEEFGDVWTFIGIERTTKLVLAFHVGKRNGKSCHHFTRKLGKATDGAFQLTTDGFPPYQHTMNQFADRGGSYALMVKIYRQVEGQPVGKYSPGEIRGIKIEPQYGNPARERICTSMIERLNLSCRMGNRRMTRLTNGHSKKWANHEAMMALFFAFYNYCRKHESLRTTPAVAAGIASEPWTLERLLTEAAKTIAA